MASEVEQEYTFGTVFPHPRRSRGQAALLVAVRLRGSVAPARGRQTYTFQDLVAVRAAKELVERGFSPAQIRKALDSVRAALPSVNRPLSACAWPGTGTPWPWSRRAAFEVTGQRLFDFGLGDLAARAASVAALPTPRPTLTNPDGIERSAYQWFTFALHRRRAARLTRQWQPIACPGG